MAYSNDIVHRARVALATKKADRESQIQARLHTAYERVPRIHQIDSLLRQSMAKAAKAAFLQGGDAKAAMERVKKENMLLQEERKQLAEIYFGPDFLDESPICEKCGGNGYVGTAMCSCLLELCRQEQKKEVALLASDDQHFGNFRLEYYPNTTDPKTGYNPRKTMERVFDVARGYAVTFTLDSGNLLLSGGTGLGKTFLSACIAREVAEQGWSVAYETANHLMNKLEKHRFRPDEETELNVKKIRQSDLLIVDDLGTEMPGSFVTASLYSLLNDRLLLGRPMVISTNLTIEEISQRYSPQIASRLQGSFQLLPFVGQDIRVMKNRGY